MESFHSGWDYIPLGVLHIFLKPHIDPLSYKRRSRKEVPERGVVVIVVLVVLVAKGRPHCTMCCFSSIMALWYYGNSRKNFFSWENNIFEATIPMLFQLSGWCRGLFFPVCLFAKGGVYSELGNAHIEPTHFKKGLPNGCLKSLEFLTLTLRGRSLHLFHVIFLINDKVMIFCVKVDWICHFISCISHSLLRFVAVRMNYQLPGTQSYSIFGTGRIGYLRKSSGQVGIP